MAFRNPTPKEKNLILFLLSNSNRKDLISSIEHLKVENMDDGEMGSLKLHPSTLCDADAQRLFGAALSEYCFDDEDGVKVIATLNLDQDGHLFELDVWKTNYEKLISFPSLELQSGTDPNGTSLSKSHRNKSILSSISASSDDHVYESILAPQFSSS